MAFTDKKTTAERKEYILEEIKTVAEKCYDVIIPAPRILRRPDCEMFQLINPEALLPMGTRPEGQLLQRLNIPASYIHRCPNDLQATNINHWLQSAKKTKLMLRMMKSDVDDDPDFCRAILSKVYRPIDDKDIFPLIFNGIEAASTDTEKKDIHIKDWFKSQDFTLLRILYGERLVEFNDRYFWAGVVVVNSETGLSALWIKPTVRSATVQYGGFDFSDISNEGATRLIHTSKAAADLSSIGLYIQEALRVSEVGITRLIEADQEIIENPVEEVENWVATSDVLSKRIIDIIATEYRQQQRVSRLALAQSILASVRDLPTFQRYLVEGETGRFLKLFGHTPKQLQKIIQAATKEEIT
jgi:hypothetical protein